jgi:hypothetical protein
MQAKRNRFSAIVHAVLRRSSSKLSVALTLLAAIWLIPVQAAAAAPESQAAISSAGLTKKQKK